MSSQHVGRRVAPSNQRVEGTSWRLAHHGRAPRAALPMNTSDDRNSATNAKTRFIEANGRKLAYRSIGSGAPIILCNRFKGTLDTWDPAFLDALAIDFRVITFDYSGLGLSTAFPTFDQLSLANDVKDIAEALGLRKIIIGGCSLGGMLAQTVTTQYPELVTHSILIGTVPPGKDSYPAEQLFFETALKPAYDLTDATILFFEPKSEASRKAAKLSEDRIAKRTSDLDTPIPRDLAARLMQESAGEHLFPDKHNSRERLKTSKTPILVISGDHDLVSPVENWYALTRELPRMQLIICPQSGHGPQHQFPEACAEYIATFIRTTE
jgi:pimeloyl-ACP methyl ester carboxylesterase